MRNFISRRRLSLSLMAAGLTCASCSSTSTRIGLESDDSVADTAASSTKDPDGLGEDFFNEDITEVTGSSISDPFGGFNRAAFKFNDKVYNYALRPVSKGYAYIMPDPVETGVENVFDNLAFPKRFAGNLLQGKFHGAAKETGKFIVNSTAGVAGIFAPADKIEGLQTPDDEDLGQAFGSWGIGHGPYLVLPLLGPFSARDGAGRISEIALNPLSYVSEPAISLGGRALEFTNDSPELLDTYDTLKDASFDPYVSAKDAYVQYRNRKLAK